MAQTSQQLLQRVKRTIKEIDIDEASSALRSDQPPLVVDVRERDEFEEGAIKDAVHVPRGYLELRIENVAPDRSRPIVLYCAGGARSALAARSLEELGYENVSSLAGGFGAWKNAGLTYVVPRVLTDEQRLRYSRHLLIPEVGEAGQLKLLDARVLLIGAGGLGSPAGLYLAAAGVGTLGIVDTDTVDASNLQRQILHNTERIGRLKTESARETIMALNPDVHVVEHRLRLSAENVLDVIADYDVIVDGADNFPTRYVLNDASVILGKPVVHGSIFRFEGQTTVFAPGQGPCYRCLFPEPPPAEMAPSCAEAGVLGVLPGIVGSIQAMEAIKLILGLGDPLVGRLMAYDALEESFRTFKVPRDPDCPACGPNAGEIVIAEYDELCMPHPIQPPS